MTTAQQAHMGKQLLAMYPQHLTGAQFPQMAGPSLCLAGHNYPSWAGKSLVLVQPEREASEGHVSAIPQ